MENKTTVKLHEALAAREGVTEIVIDPYETFQIVQDQRIYEFTGPARVLINID
ncbi:BC1881 family protein [Solibacillus sp. CAU 1738]|uniref:BC1881 family protein n=1 Tax=Solibacillus sp. CAU 1738 TaxID=3140363 RepID=UPI003260D3E8